MPLNETPRIHDLFIWESPPLDYTLINSVIVRYLITPGIGEGGGRVEGGGSLYPGTGHT